MHCFFNISAFKFTGLNMVLQTPVYHKYFLLILVLFFNSPILLGQENKILTDLLQTIQDAPKYDQAKLERIKHLHEELENTRTTNLEKRYYLNHELLNEYKVFKQDSAFKYGLETKELAFQQDRDDLFASAIIDLADISVSAGMYKEALDFLQIIDPETIHPNIRSLYFGLMGRCYSEMAEYSNLPYYSTNYNVLAANYRKAALALTENGTFFNSFLKAFIEIKNGDLDKALTDFQNLLKRDLGLRERALVDYTLGDLYFQQNKKDSSIFHFARASIADIKTSTKENLASIRLAELLFEKDEIKSASTFIQKAYDDATFFGAQQRKIRVGAILPLIEEKIVQQIESQRKSLYLQNIIVSFLLLFVLGLAIIIYAQVSKLKKAKKIIVGAHKKLQKTNEKISSVNDQINIKNNELILVYNKLLEANKIKEECIGFFFTQDADIFEKFREFKCKVEKNINEENIPKIKHLISNYDFKREKEKLLNSFDEAFIKLFPKFIEEFNSLLQPEEKIKIKSGKILNKELRIFALMRLGIIHNEIIAQILGFSVNSIYTYKTKIRKKSLLNKKDFDQKLFENTTLRL